MKTFKLFLLLALGLLSLFSSSFAASNDYREQNLGPTGLFGVVSPKDIKIVKVEPGSPADGKIKPGDVFTGAAGKPFQKLTRKQLAQAIDQAEATGKLSFTRQDGSTIDLTLPILGSYSDTAPINCPKTNAIITRTADFLVSSKKFGRDNIPIALLGLLSTGEPKYIDFVKQQVRLAPWANPDIKLSLDTYARTAWNWGYTTLFLAEYYLLTKDKYVLPALEAHAVALAMGRDAGGLWGHGFASRDLNNGQLHGRLQGYAHMNQSSLPCFLGILLAQKAGIRHPEITATIAQNNTFYSDFIGRGTLPYGVHNPNAKAFNNNGMSGLTAVAFSVHDNQPGAEFFSRMSVASHNTMEQGHTGHYFNQLWTGLGANIAGPEASSAFFQETKWLHILNRKWNGDFTYDGSGTKNPVYTYRDLSDAGSHLINHCRGRRVLYSTGRDSNKSLWLTKEQTKATLALASLDVTKSSDAELLANFGHPMPKIRIDSVWTLRNRKHTQEPAIRAMLLQGTKYQRESAISYFGSGCDKQIALSAKPDLLKILRDPATPLDLRAAAASSLSHLGPDAYEIFPDLLQFIVAKKPEDPLGRTNETLGQALNTLAPDPYAAKLITDKALFYRAIETLLLHPRASGRTLGTGLIANIPLADFPIVGKELAAILADTNRTYHSYHNLNPRNGTLSIYANLGIVEGIPAAFAILDEETGKFGFKLRLLMDVLPKYGAAAQPYLPKLKEMNVKGRFEKPWNNMMKNIEAASPSQQKALTFEQAMKAGSK